MCCRPRVAASPTRSRETWCGCRARRRRRSSPPGIQALDAGRCRQHQLPAPQQGTLPADKTPWRQLCQRILGEVAGDHHPVLHSSRPDDPFGARWRGRRRIAGGTSTPRSRSPGPIKAISTAVGPAPGGSSHLDGRRFEPRHRGRSPAHSTDQRHNFSGSFVCAADPAAGQSHGSRRGPGPSARPPTYPLCSTPMPGLAVGNHSDTSDCLDCGGRPRLAGGRLSGLGRADGPGRREVRNDEAIGPIHRLDTVGHARPRGRL